MKCCFCEREASYYVVDWKKKVCTWHVTKGKRYLNRGRKVHVRRTLKLIPIASYKEEEHAQNPTENP